MLQTQVYGKDRVEFMESIIVGDVQGLKDNHGTLSLFTTPSGRLAIQKRVNIIEFSYEDGEILKFFYE